MNRLLKTLPKLSSQVWICVAGLIFTIWYPLNQDWHKSFNPMPRHILALSVTISELHYGLTGYTGFTKVMNTFLLDYGGIGSNVGDGTGNSAGIINTTINKALNIKEVNSEGVHYFFTKLMSILIYFSDVGMPSGVFG